MGHVRLGVLPKSRKWRQVVEELRVGAGIGEIAALAAEAAETSFQAAAADPAFLHSFWLLTQVPLAARGPAFAEDLGRLGVNVSESPSLMGVVAAISAAVDRHARDLGGRTDLGEMAQMAAVESLTAVVAPTLPSLFGPSPAEVQRAIGRLAGGDRFSTLAREFFARLTQRTLDYYLSRELSRHIGAGERFRDDGARSQFDQALDRHCREASRIVEEFAGGWYGKNVYQGSGLTLDAVRKFAPVAFKKFGPNFGSAEMPTNEHLVLCGGLTAPSGVGSQISLNLHGKSPSVHLKIADIRKRLLVNIPDALVDLLELASYVYAADSAVSRGGRADAQMGARWRRRFRFVIPVRLPSLWSSAPVASALVETLSFLSDDEYDFEFRSLNQSPSPETYFEFPEADESRFTPDEVILFSGGLDSFAGTIDRLALHGKKVALVSHRSGSKIPSAQSRLVKQIRSQFGADRVLHVPVWMTLEGNLGKEMTHRSRSFLFAALGVVTARLFGRDQLTIFENGVVSLNLPSVGQVIGTRATRTTHPQVLARVSRLVSSVPDRPFRVENPFIWFTKTDVVERIMANGCSDLIRDTRSCTRVHDMTILHPHCGRCSQCIDRRFAIIAAGQVNEDPAEAYKVDLFLGDRQPGPDSEIALSFVRSASVINRMTDEAFFSHFGETSRVVDQFEVSTDAVAGYILDLHRRHASAVCQVFEDAIRSHASHLLEGTLPAGCLLSLVVSRSGDGGFYSVASSLPGQSITVAQNIRIAIDARRRCVFFDRWGVLSGVNANLIIVLTHSFKAATLDERAPENYPFMKSEELASLTGCDNDETLRRRIHRCRKGIKKLAESAGDLAPSLDAVIENSQWHGYRLNPDRVRIVAVSELSASE